MLVSVILRSVLTPAMLLLAGAPCNAHPRFALQPVVTDVTVSTAPGGYRAHARVAFDVKTIVSAHFPPQDSAPAAHARGHELIARKVARSAYGTIDAVGSSKTQARERLRQSIARMRADAQRELEREERVYETVTENGARQSAGPAFGLPGGPDSDTPCER